MSDDAQRSSPLTDSRLRVVYGVGIALNAVALAMSATSGEWLVAATFGVVIAYLSIRFWMIHSK